MSVVARLDAVRALRIGDRDEADDAAVATAPAPGEGSEGHALACHLIDIAADILESVDAVAEDLAMARLPQGELIGDLLAGLLLVLLAGPWE